MKVLHIALMLAGIGITAQAQTKPQLYSESSPYERYSHYTATLRGGAGIPVGPFASGYVDKLTLENYALSVDWILQRPVSIGLEAGHTFFSKKLPRTIYSIEGQDISAVQTRTIKLMPIQGVVSFYMGSPAAAIRPYVQLAAGGSLLDYSLYYGSLANQQQSLKFTYGAAIGSRFLFKRDGSVGADLRVKYNQTALNFDYIDQGIGQVNATVGLFYRWW
jgi:hypothetical protein